jgi:very-short-patch-repair endonuclease
MSDSIKKIGAARSLRRRMTSAERRLWSKLRDHRFYGLQFVRQQPIDRYVLDFYCSVARLGIELDGAAHAYQSKADAERQQFLEELGIAIVRVPNFAVMNSIELVLAKIHAACKGHLSEGEASSDSC